MSTKATHKSSARARLLQAGWELITEHGLAGTAMDDVIERAGVAKQTLYNHFPTKPELIRAVLESGAKQFEQTLIERTLARSTAPADRLTMVFPVIQEMLCSAKFPGCTFSGAAVEDRGEPGEATLVTRMHKRAVRATLETWAIEAELAQPSELASHLMLLVEGALMTSLLERSGEPFDHARQAAEVLVEHARPRHKR